MDALMERFVESATAWGPMAVAAAAVLLVGWLLARLGTGLFRRVMGRAKVDPTLTAFLSNILYMGLMALVLISAAGQLGVNTTSFAAVIAAAGLAIGFALQGSLSNFAAGVMLILFRPFKAGDFIEAGGVAGVVEEIGIFATRMRSGDNKEITIPNGQITGGSVVNYSAKPTRRIDLVFGIGYGDEIARARSVIERVLAAEERILPDPAPVIAVGELGDSSVNLLVRPWVQTADYWPVHWGLLERMKLEFDRENISIPFPQRDVHLQREVA